MSAPNPREIQEFQFQLLSRLRIFYDDYPLPINESLSLVAAASKYGLVFVGCLKGLRVIQIQKIVDLYAHEKKKPTDTSDYPSRIITLSTQPTHLEVNCDNQYLAVSRVEDDSSIIEIYDVPSFASEEESIALELRPGKRVSSLSWNPGNNAMLAVCLVDGSAVVYDLKNNIININSIPPEAHATCLCWSPKGKQIVIGSANGAINQFKPDLKIVKSIPPPPSQNPLSVVSVQWLSNFQFAAVYKDASDGNKPVTALYIVNTPKGQPMTYINYDDICFSTSYSRSPQYFITHQQNWNVLLVASGTSMELGVLGQQSDFWEQWIQEDQFRAELPLRTAKKEETFPVGMALDTSVQYNLPFGENQSLPPMPLLILLSDEGLLSLFFVVNILPSAANICSPPQPLPNQSGLHHFKFPSKDVSNEQDVKAAPTALITPTILNQPQLHSYDISQAATQVQSQTTQPETPPQPSWLGQAQTSSIPNWVTAATPTTATVPSSHPSSITGFLAATSTSSTAAPLGPFSGSKLTQSFVLPGSQVTITPVAPSSGGISQPAAPTSTPLVLPMYSISTASPQTPTTPSKFTTNIAQMEVKKCEPATSQLTDLSPVKSDEASELTKEETSINNDAVILSAITEEIAIFNSELEEMCTRRSKMNIFIGTEEQKTEIEQQMQSLEAFFKELKEITVTQKAEVQSLKNSLFEAFSWVEDAKSQVEQYKNPYYIKLVRSRDLDPVTARKLASIESMIYYIDRQVSQANKLLDSLGCSLQSKLPKNTIKVPSLETVYQTMIMLNNIHQHQAMILDDIEDKLKLGRKRANRISRISDLTFSHSKDSESNELSKLAENILKIKLGKSSVSNLSGTENHYIVGVPPKKLSDSKKKTIFKALCERPIPLIKSPTITNLPGKISSSSSISTLLSSLPSSGAKPGGISSGKPIFSSSTPKLSTSVAQAQNTVNVELPNMASNEISGNDNLARTRVLGVVKNNLVPTFNLESSVKQSPVSALKELQTNLYGNKENKPTTTVTLTTQPIVSNSQPQSKLSSFTVTDKIPNNEVFYAREPNIEFSIPTSSTSSIPFTLSSTSSSSHIVSSATNDSSTQVKSPLSSLTNMVSGFVETLPRLNTEKPTSLKTSTNQSFQFSFPIADTNKTIQSSVSTALKTTIIPTTSKTTTAPASDDSVLSKNLFGENTGTQNVSSAEPGISNSVFSGNSKTNKSLFGGDSTNKNIFGGDSTAKNVFGADTVTPQSIFGGDSLTNKNLFNSNISSTIKNVFESDSTKSKGVFSSESSTPSGFDKDVSSSSIFGHNSNATKSSFTTESKSDILTTDLSSSINKPSDITKGATITQKNVSSLSKSSPVPSTPGSPKSVVGREISSSQKAVFGEEPTITKTEQSTEITRVDSTQTVKKEDNSQVESSSSSFGVVGSDKSSSPKSVLIVEPTIAEPSTETNVDSTTLKNDDSLQGASGPSLFGSLSLGPASSIPQIKPAGNIFGGSSGTLGPSNVETVSAETTTKEAEPSVFEISSPVTTTASSFNFGVAGASLFGNQSKPEATPAVTSSPTKTDSTLNFGQLAVSATEAPSASASVTAPSVAAFSFTLPQSTTTPTTSTFSFAQTGTISSTTSDDKNTKISLTFGQSSNASGSSIFGGFNTQPVTTPSSSSLFGAPPASSAPQSSFTFALSGTTAPQNNFFGNTSNVFGSTPATTNSSFFGSQTTTSSVFGQPSVTTPVFGQVATSQTSSPFGSSSGFGAKPTFGQSGGSLFGQSSSGGFGSGGSGGGGTSMFGGGASLFGSASSSGSNPFQSSGTGSLFGGGGTTTGGSFSSGGQSVSETGFGSPSSFQNKMGGFGATPTFGGSPPAFGGAPTFGSSAAFGSPKMFGSSSPSGAFGSNTQQSPGFESLANQNTMTFGNLAQNQPGSFGSGSIFGGTAQTQQQQQQTGFSNPNSSFSGSSFSSWR